MISNPLAHTIASLALRKWISLASEGIKKSCVDRESDKVSTKLVCDQHQQGGKLADLEDPEACALLTSASKEIPSGVVSSRVERDRLEHPEHAVELLLLAVRDEGPVGELTDAEEEHVSRPAQTLRSALSVGVLRRHRGRDESLELVREQRLESDKGHKDMVSLTSGQG